jgi:hypothetical protein
MITKWLKTGVIAAVGLSIAGGLLFGKDVVSYICSSAKSVRTVVKDSVPVEFELKRARDMLEEIIPEMYANIRLIAEEEVEVAALKVDIAKGKEANEQEQMRIARLREELGKSQAVYYIGRREYPRSYVKEDLAHRFERFKESELVLASKERLLTARQTSLDAAMRLLERTKTRKRELEDKIEALASQHRLIKAASIGSNIQVDNSKLAKTEKLINEIKKRLDVAERVLAHESQFVQAIPVDVVPEKDLLIQVDDYFNNKQKQQTSLARTATQESGQSLEN